MAATIGTRDLTKAMQAIQRLEAGFGQVEITAPRTLPLDAGQVVSLAPQSYRLFPDA